MKIKRLTIETLYLQTLKEFYSSILELPVSIIDENEIVVQIGSSELIITEGIEKEAVYHFAINIPANKIEEARSWLMRKVKLLWINDDNSEIANFSTWHAQSVYFYDPAGNILELISRHDLKNENPEVFSSAQFLSLSEVGLVFNQDKMEQKTMELQRRYGLTFFAKQAPLPHFKAFGDDEGLFIAVPENRNWYPTDKPSGIFPMTIEFENDGIMDILDL